MQRRPTFVMHEYAGRLAGLLTVDEELKREFEARLAECSRLAFRVAFAVLRHRQDAEDVAQEAFVRAYRHFHELRNRDRFRAWLVRTAWRLALDQRRGDQRRLQRDSREPIERADGPTAMDAVLAEERAAHLWEAIDALPEKLRAVLILAAIEGMDIESVARLLSIPTGTVKSRLFLARQRLKEQLTWTKTSLNDV
jgi:RNA polymerase sigma-70 factor (ECF subfamily)